MKKIEEVKNKYKKFDFKTELFKIIIIKFIIYANNYKVMVEWSFKSLMKSLLIIFLFGCFSGEKANFMFIWDNYVFIYIILN